jgi:hypothetical protein
VLLVFALAAPKPATCSSTKSSHDDSTKDSASTLVEAFLDALDSVGDGAWWSDAALVANGMDGSSKSKTHPRSSALKQPSERALQRLLGRLLRLNDDLQQPSSGKGGSDNHFAESIRSLLVELMQHANPGVHRASGAAASDEHKKAGRRRRKLAQQQGAPPRPPPQPPPPPPPPAAAPLGAGAPSAFNLVFTNLFDALLQRGLYFLIPTLGDAAAALQRYNWYTDAADGADAGADNLVNALLFPLPQSDADARALVDRFLGDFCSPAAAAPGEAVLLEFAGPSLRIELTPASCPIRRANSTRRNYIAFDACEPARVTVSVTPYTVTSAYESAATYRSAACAYEDLLGTDVGLSLGGGSVKYDLVATAERVDIVPTIDQLNLDLVFRRYGPAPPPANNSEADTIYVEGQHQAGIVAG